MRTRLVVTWLWASSSLMMGAGNLAAQSTAPAGGSAQADPTDLALVGNRFPPLKWAQMNEQQKTMMRHVLDGPIDLSPHLSGLPHALTRPQRPCLRLRQTGPFATGDHRPVCRRTLAFPGSASPV